MKSHLSRRMFLAGTGLLGAAMVGLAGCSPQAPASQNLGDAGAQDTPAASESKLISVDDADVSATEEADIVVVGSGTGGTYAAVRAAEAGAKVIWLEKTSLKGGSSTCAEMLTAPNTKQQIEESGQVDTQPDFESIMAWHNWGAYAPAVRSYLDNAHFAVDWALEHDVKLRHQGNGHYMCSDDNGAWLSMGDGMLKPLWEFGDTLPNLDFRLETPAVNLVFDEGKVAGVYAASKDGSVTRINAKAVILASGGFGSNDEMKAAHLRVPYERIGFVGFEGADGDGINMALAAGGVRHAPSAVAYGLTRVIGDSWDGMMTIFLQWPTNTRSPYPTGGFLPMVNEHGSRFFNESFIDEIDSSKLNAAIASQPMVFTVCDDKHVETYSGFDEFDYHSGIAHGNLRECLETSDAVVKADTFEELAEKMGVDVETFVATIDDYNSRAKGDGTHDPFGMNASCMTVLEQPPFYAAKVEATAWGTYGGVRGSYHMEAVDENNDPIEGLYVVSLDNGSMAYNDYQYGLHPGTTQGNACCTGFVAAEHACKTLGLLS